MFSSLLVNATDIVQWADRLDSRSKIPEVIRKLILSTNNNLEHISFPSGEGTNLGGYDGVTLTNKESTFVPLGLTVWELGTDKNYKSKANNEYKKRTEYPKTVIPSKTTFIFITPRRFNNKKEWEKEKNNEGIWKDVKVYDADDIETWLSTSPSVHIWLSMYLGKNPDSAIDLDNFWNDWSEETSPVFSTELVLAGRENIPQSLHDWLHSENTHIALQSESLDESIAIFFASIKLLPNQEMETFLSKSVVVYDINTWKTLTLSHIDLILIPAFSIKDGLGRAINNGHNVFIPLSYSDSTSSGTIISPRINREKAKLILQESGISSDKSNELSLLARRSITAFRRKISLRPEIKKPFWAESTMAHLLLPFLFIGAWDENMNGDKEVVSKITKTDYEDVTKLLLTWANEPDTPIRKSGDSWYIISKEDVWLQISKYISHSNLDRFKNIALDVLCTPDPKYKLDSDKQWYANIIGYSPSYSQILQKNIADTLAFMGSREDNTNINNFATSILFEMYNKINNDLNIWFTLSTNLPLLAEASPDLFFSVLEEKIDNNEEFILNFFQDQQYNIFSSSPHSGVLWSLETLAWSTEHISRSALLLAKLSRIDPGGKLSNRPINSLREIFLPWNPQTSASLDSRIIVLKLLISNEPEIAWSLLNKLLPERSNIGQSTSKPKWREWAINAEKHVLQKDYVKAIDEFIKMLLNMAGYSGKRWANIIESLGMLPTNFNNILEKMRDLDIDKFPQEDLFIMWDTLRELISRHRSYPNEDWSMPISQVEELENLLEMFEPMDKTRKYLWLYSDFPNYPAENIDWDVNDKMIEDARHTALFDIYYKYQLPGIYRMINDVENSFILGNSLGKIDLSLEEENELINIIIDDTNNNNFQFIKGYLSSKINEKGNKWAVSKFIEVSESWQLYKKSAILTCLNSNSETWKLVESLGTEVEQLYWSLISPYSINMENVDTAVQKYLQFELPSSAISLLVRKKEYTNYQHTIDTLMILLKLPNEQTKINPTHISILFRNLQENSDINETIVASLEWAYLPILVANNSSPKFLHRELTKNPDFFATIISYIYDSETKDEDRIRARQGYDLLNSWKTIPGTDDTGSLNEKELISWIENALQRTTELGKSTKGAYHIGMILSKSPKGEDGAWPHEIVRNILDKFYNKEIERGLVITLYNSKGATSRGLTEGGEQERTIAKEYHLYAEACKIKWPRTAAVLREIENHYNRHARLEDIDAEQHEDLY